MSEGLSHNPESSAIEVKSYASRIYKLESKCKEISKLPENVPLIVSSKKDARRLHTVSLVVWHEAYSPKEVKKYVTGLAEGKYKKGKKKEIVNKLSETRIFGQIRRSAESLFDSSHKPPKELDKLIVMMGKLKDHPGKEKKYAKKLLKAVKAYNNNIDEIEKDFKPTNGKSFINYIHERARTMRGVLAAGDPKKIELQHIVRKKGTREFLVLTLLEIISDQNLNRKDIKKLIKVYSLFHQYDDLYQNDLQKYHEDKKAYNKLKPKKRKNATKPILRIRPKKNKELIKVLNNLEEQWQGEVKKGKKKKK